MDADELMQRKRRQSVGDAARQAAISGAVSGGALGGITSLLGGTRSKAALLKAALLGAGGGAGVAAGTTALGGAIMGAPEEDDPNAYTRRGAVGGLVGGGVLGAGIGALLTKGRMKAPGLVGDYFTKLGTKGASGLKQGAAAGSLGGALGAAYMGSDEGMQVDAINQELLRRRKAAMLEEYGE